MSEWLQTVRTKLSTSGFTLMDNIAFGQARFICVARKSGVDLTKFGYSETFFIFNEFASLNSPAVRGFSAEAFRCALKLRRNPLPCGLFESVWCYAVAIGRNVDQATLESIQNLAPARHWAAAEMPVVYDTATGKLAYFTKTPLWGAAYYKGFRTTITRYLGS